MVAQARGNTKNVRIPTNPVQSEADQVGGSMSDDTEDTGLAFPPGGLPADVLLRALVEMTDDAVITCNTAARVTFFSENAERLFGRPGDDVVDRPIDVLFPVHLGGEMQRVVATVVAGERIRHFETELLRPDGLPIPVSLSLAPLTDAGRLAGCIVVARDVTEQHLAQATLAEVDARLEEAEALAHVGSWLWDVRTGAVQWSSEFHRIHGIDPLDFPGTFESYMDLIELEDRVAVRRTLQDAVRSSRPVDLEYRVVDPDGKWRVVRVHAQPTRGSDGNTVGLRGIGRDVTDTYTEGDLAAPDTSKTV
jgi:PAS domain S-box-containing protein